MGPNNTNAAPETSAAAAPARASGLSRRGKIVGACYAAIAFIGFIDASYLAMEYLTGSVPLCTLIKGCDIVTRSAYAVMAGIPVSVLGALYYLAILVAAIIALDTKNQRLLKWIGWFTIVGFGFSIYFFLIQAIALKAFCLYCLGSALTSTLLFATGVLAAVGL